MSVKVDYLVVCSHSKDLTPILAKLLGDVIETAYNEEDIDYEPPEDEELRQCITLRYTKIRGDGRQICGFSVDFDVASMEFDIASVEMEELIREFSKAVAKCTLQGIEHLLKLNDSQLQCTLRRYGNEIFEIEMKLREALSLIFINTYGEDFYALLKEVKVEPTGKSAPAESQMQAQYENQFFSLVFSDYININVRKDLNLDRIKEYMGWAEDFEELKRRITTNPIAKEEYADFLASLQKRVGPIGELRNCVAHNKSIPKKTLENYKMVKDPLLKSIEEFLEQQENHKGNYKTKTN